MSSREYSHADLWNRDLVEELYVERRWSGERIAEETGVSFNTVYDWLDRYGFERHYGKPRTSDSTATGGYEIIHGDGSSIPVHRLVAVAEYGIDAVKGMHVHHKNNIPWDNRPENLQLLTPAEHTRLHSSNQFDPHGADSI